MSIPRPFSLNGATIKRKSYVAPGRDRLGRSTFYRLIEQKQFPAPVKVLGLRVSAWLASEIAAWQKDKPGLFEAAGHRGTPF